MIRRPEHSFRPARILIVDDELRNRELLEVMLAPDAFHLESAASGAEALAIVEREAPDLILLDVMMPGIDGYEVAGRLKADPVAKSIPIIMVTALDDRDARMRSLSAGAEEFLTKPVDRAELRIRVRNMLRLKAYGEASEQILKDQMRFKDEFLSHVSHELRSPLTAIKQFSTILAGGLAGELNEEQLQYQRIVLKNIRQLQSMIDDLLEVTRLETGKLTIEPECASLPEAVSDALETLQETARAKGVALASEIAPGLPAAFADPTRVRQILINLLENAIKFTPEGGSAIVRAFVASDPPGFLTLEVSDTGCGIGAEIAESLFERLHQVSDRIETSRKGLGLGLYISRELVTRQGGTIRIDPDRGPGCTVTLTLPVFSLGDLILPLVVQGRWPMETLALVRVETRVQGDLPGGEAQAEASRDLRALLQRCLMEHRDALLPRFPSGPGGENNFVAAFADEAGASALLHRIREQLDRFPHLSAGRSQSVSYVMLQPASRNAVASVSGTTERLEQLIHSQSTAGRHQA